MNRKPNRQKPKVESEEFDSLYFHLGAIIICAGFAVALFCAIRTIEGVFK